MSVNRPVSILLLIALLGTTLAAQPGDDAVELYLRDRGMTQLLETQLETRLERASDEAERARLAESLAGLYLDQLREIDANDPYRGVVVVRARSLLSRVEATPMLDLRLELLVNDYSEHEEAVELHRLGLLGESRRSTSRGVLVETARSLRNIERDLAPELERLTRRRTQPMGSDASRDLADEIETKRRQHSLASYYLGWCGYGIAVLENRHVEDDTFIAFAWLLGGEGGMPQQSELRGAALEFDHVARSAIGVAMCYAQSEGYSLAESWLNELLDSDLVGEPPRQAAQSRKLQVLAMARDWYEAHVFANQISNEDAGAFLSVADARFITIQALDSRVSGVPGDGGKEHAEKVAQLGIEHLIERGEIGHVVDLYQRYQSLPLLASGFIPNYAKALAELERLESSGRDSGYQDIARQFEQALKAGDASDYPAHNEDCRLKLAYTLVRADRPDEAIPHCDRIIEGSLRAEAIEEARWLKIAALDRQNTLAGRSFSAPLDAAVRVYVEAYPGSSRTARLVLRHAMRGTLDERLAIETLASIPEDDPIAVPARRTLVQLQYQSLRQSAFNDRAMLRDTRELIDWLIERPLPETGNQDTARTELAIFRIGIDLALRDDPPDPRRAESLIQRAESRHGSTPSFGLIEPELLVRRVQIALLDDRIDRAMSTIDTLRRLDEDQAHYAELLTLNTIVERWETQRRARDARVLVEFGVPVLARMTPGAPERINPQVSSLIEIISDAAEHLAERDSDDSLFRLALRLSRQVLDRGQPSEPGLRRTAALASRAGDAETELEAWLRLLAAYPQDESRWYEARYESLRVMRSIDPVRARSTFEQFRVLNPQLGPEPWNQRIASLFPDQPAEPTPSDSPEDPEGRSP